ncbi:MAG: NAD(P)-dependent oxidoreductase [Anaerolineales bacterium]
MADKKQILILEELGVPRATFEEIAAKAGLSFNIVWENPTKADSVEVIVTVKTKVGQQLLAKYPNTKVIAVAFTGYDCVDLDICRRKDIAVYNVPAYSTNSVAELAVGLAISLLRELPAANNVVHSGKWNLKPGQELSGKTVGILGTGSIGTLVANYFKTFGCNIVGWSRTEKEQFKLLGNYISDLQKFFSTPDIISIHLPLNVETKGLVGKEELSAMRSTAYLINTARGPIVDEKALIEALSTNKIAGAALDVFTQEPIDPESRLLHLENVILTPHIAYKTIEALEHRARITINNIINFQNGNKTNRVG